MPGVSSVARLLGSARHPATTAPAPDEIESVDNPQTASSRQLLRIRIQEWGCSGKINTQSTAYGKDPAVTWRNATASWGIAPNLHNALIDKTISGGVGWVRIPWPRWSDGSHFCSSLKDVYFQDKSLQRYIPAIAPRVIDAQVVHRA